MKLLSTLLGRLSRAFNQDPLPFLGFILGYSGTDCVWQISDGQMTLTPTDGGLRFVINLSSFTVASLAAYIGGQVGYSATNVSAAYGGLSALVLLEGGDYTADVSGNGGRIYGYTNPLFAFMDAYAAELELARATIAMMPAEMSTTTADGQWLDYLGSVFVVPRYASELDSQYALRIIAQTIAPKGNNKAIEAAIASYTGQSVSITDVVEYGGNSIIYSGEINFDGTHTYNGSMAQVIYGLFDAVIGYDIINGGSIAAFQAQVIQTINSLRDAGTQLRALSLTGSSLIDSPPNPSEAGDSLTIARGYFFDGSLTFNGGHPYGTTYSVGTLGG